MLPLRGGLAPLTLASEAPVVPNGLLANLVAYWALDEAGGANNALDKHTNALTLTQVSSPGSAAGLVYAGARTFASASSQYFSRASEALLQCGATAYSWSVWIYPTTSITSRYIINKRQDGGNYYALRTDAAGKLIWDEYSAGTKRIEIITNTVPTLNAWQIITVVVTRGDTSNTKIYIGTTDITTGTPTSLLSYGDNTGALNIGRWGGGGNYYDGSIGPVAFWHVTALDATARTALYNAGAGLAYAEFTN